MAYLVNIPARNAYLERLYSEIDGAGSVATRRWYKGLKKQILSLEEHPNRCPVTPEKKTVRQLLYGHKHGVYRVIYRVFEKKRVVEVLHKRHGARNKFRTAELE
ncbi:MAG: type II toxin-antitoxin system RelE/ParE family toxin [Terriglobales bacterium]|jgi:plasmid stabilization system protein ParE